MIYTPRTDASDCQHDHITTWRWEDNGRPAGMHSCSSCRVKFVLITELIAAEKERDEARASQLETQLLLDGALAELARLTTLREGDLIGWTPLPELKEATP